MQQVVACCGQGKAEWVNLVYWKVSLHKAGMLELMAFKASSNPSKFMIL